MLSSHAALAALEGAWIHGRPGWLMPEVGGITGQDPAVYEGEYVYWPWARLVRATEQALEVRAPQGGVVLDYMCGTGFLMDRLRRKRRDLTVLGCDLDREFIAYGRDHYPGLELCVESVFDFEPAAQPAVIVCTGGLHHLPRARRNEFLAKCSRELMSGGLLLIGEEVIADHHGDASRRLAVLELYYAILSQIIQADAPADVVESAVAAMRKELIEEGTSKETARQLRAALTRHFVVEAFDQTWPDAVSEHGDYLAVCRPKETR